MQKDTKILVGILLTTFVLLGGMYLFFYTDTTTDQTVDVSVVEDKPRDVESKEDKQKDLGKEQEFEQRNPPESGAIQSAVIEGKELAKGKFEKVENGLIYYIDDNQHFSSVLNDTDIVLSCTTQDLTNAEEIDFTKIREVQIHQSSEITSLIPIDEPIIILSSKNPDGNYIAHTVALSIDKCK